MLIQFSVENFLSIKDNVVLSLLASKDNEHPEHLIVDGVASAEAKSSCNERLSAFSDCQS